MKEEINSIDIFKAANYVKDNVGEPIAIIKTDDQEFAALAYRENAPFEDRKYSTHYVYPRGCESGNYDMTLDEAFADLLNRSGTIFGV